MKNIANVNFKQDINNLPNLSLNGIFFNLFWQSFVAKMFPDSKKCFQYDQWANLIPFDDLKLNRLT